jgi:hypothetical protein
VEERSVFRRISRRRDAGDLKGACGWPFVVRANNVLTVMKAKSMSNRDLVLDYLQSITPGDASNGEIVARTGVRPHQQVFMITRDLMQSGQIKGLQAGYEWRFWYDRKNLGNLAEPSARPIQYADWDEPYPWDTANALECRIGMSWVKLGRVLLDGGRLKFPTTQPTPGLYRFRIRIAGREALYVGETENIARRFTLYSNPGPSQQTNRRLNARFREDLSGGAEIAVAIVTTGAWIEFADTKVAADFSSKAVRRLFEHAAIVQSAADTIESLNR